jgi:hypothetical protein
MPQCVRKRLRAPTLARGPPEPFDQGAGCKLPFDLGDSLRGALEPKRDRDLQNSRSFYENGRPDYGLARRKSGQSDQLRSDVQSAPRGTSPRQAAQTDDQKAHTQGRADHQGVFTVPNAGVAFNHEAVSKMIRKELQELRKMPYLSDIGRETADKAERLFALLNSRFSA